MSDITKGWFCLECTEANRENTIINMQVLAHWSVPNQVWQTYGDEPWDIENMSCGNCGADESSIKEQQLVYVPSSVSTGSFQWIPTEMLEDWDASLLENFGQYAVDQAQELRTGPKTPMGRDLAMRSLA